MIWHPAPRDLPHIFLNHWGLVRSLPERQGKNPRELKIGQDHPHWLTPIGRGPLQPQLS
jgi:hypothetical protein